MTKKNEARQSKSMKSDKVHYTGVIIDTKLLMLQKQYLDVLNKLEVAKKRRKELEEIVEITKGKSILDVPIETLNLKELRVVDKFLEELENIVSKRKEELLRKQANPGESSSAAAAATSVDTPTLHVSDVTMDASFADAHGNGDGIGN